MNKFFFLVVLILINSYSFAQIKKTTFTKTTSKQKNEVDNNLKQSSKSNHLSFIKKELETYSGNFVDSSGNELIKVFKEGFFNNSYPRCLRQLLSLLSENPKDEQNLVNKYLPEILRYKAKFLVHFSNNNYNEELVSKYTSDFLDFENNMGKQASLETEAKSEKYGKVCSYGNRAYSDIPLYCNTFQFETCLTQEFCDPNFKYTIGGVVGKSNYSFSGIKAKKNTQIGFFPAWRYWVYDDMDENDAMNKSISGTVAQITIDGSHSFFMYGSGYSIEFPDGTEVQLRAVVLRPAEYRHLYNWVISAKLGQDANIPTLGLVKKGKTIHGHFSEKDGAQPSQGYLTVEDN